MPIWILVQASRKKVAEMDFVRMYHQRIFDYVLNKGEWD